MPRHHVTPTIRKRPDGKFATTSITNELAEALNAGANGGDHGQIDDEIRPAGGFWGRVVAAGPAAEADYTDARYWIRSVYIDNDETDPLTAAVVWTDYLAGDDGYRYVTATNLAEAVAGSHATPISTIVWVDEDEDPGDPSTERYVFTSGGSGGGDNAGLYQGQVHTMLTDLVSGWDFPKLHGGSP